MKDMGAIFPYLHATLVGSSGAIVLLVGVHILLKRPRDTVNRCFFVLAASLSIWLIGFAVGGPSQTAKDAFLWQVYFSHTGLIIIGPAALLFAAAFTHQIPRLKPLIIASFLVAPLFYLFLFLDPDVLFTIHHHYFGWYKHWGAPLGWTDGVKI